MYPERDGEVQLLSFSTGVGGGCGGHWVVVDGVVVMVISVVVDI